MTNKQNETEAWVGRYIDKYGRPPSYDEVAKAFKISVCAAYNRCRSFRHRMKHKTGTMVKVTVHFVVPIEKMDQFGANIETIKKSLHDH